MKKEILENKLIRSWFRTLLIATAIVVFIIIVGMITLNWYTRHGERLAMPLLVGMTIEEAQSISEGMDMRFDVIDSVYIESEVPGAILDQYPKAGNFIKSGRRITVVTNTHMPKNVKMPYVAGYSLRQAKNRLVSSGIQIDKLVYVEDIATNNIVRQEYNGTTISSKSNITVPVNSKVTLYVGLGSNAPTLRAPNLINDLFYIAKERLWEEGINVSVVEAEKMSRSAAQKARVYKQRPLPGESMQYGQVLTLYITSDSSKVSRGMRNYKSTSKKLTDLREKIKETEEMLKVSTDEDMIQYEMELTELRRQLDSLKLN